MDSAYKLISVEFSDGSVYTYYTALSVSKGDKLVVATKLGAAIATARDIGLELDFNPFAIGVAHKHILENITKHIINTEVATMSLAKIVEVKHVGSNRRGVFYTDIPLSVGEKVVYESADEQNNGTGLHVGEVVNTEPRATIASSWIVDVVDMGDYIARMEKQKEIARLRKQLDAKTKQFKDMELLRLIAERDPETKKLLDDYIELTK